MTMEKMNKDEAIEIVKKFNKENRYRDGGKINNAIDIVVEMAEETNKIKNSLTDVLLKCAEQATREMEDDLLYGKPIREPLKDKIKRLEEELKKEKEKSKQLEIELEIKKYCKVNELANDLIYYKNLAKEYQGNCISKDKIRELLEKYDKDIAWDSADDHYYFTKFIKELLEENK